MIAIEANPSINLYAYFQHKCEFDFEYEIYDCSTILILEEGSFSFRIDEEDTLLAQAGSIVFCPPCCALHRKSLSPMKLHMIRFDGLVLNQTLYSISPRIKSNLLHTSPYGPMVKRASSPVLVHYCKDIIYSLFEQEESYPDINQILSYMDEYFDRAISNKELCRMMHCSEVSMISRFKDAAGTTPQQYLTQKRLQYAKQLLMTTDMSHQEIAFKCGYSDPLYFSRIFSKHNGISPTEFKRQFRL